MKKALFTIIALVILAVIAAGAYLLHARYGAVNIPTTSPAIGNDSAEGFGVPVGFEMSVYASGIDDARVMAFGPDGVMLVSEPAAGKIVALRDEDGDGKADPATTVVSGLNAPHGIAFKCAGDLELQSCKLYVAERDALDVFDYDKGSLQATDKQKLMSLPSGGVSAHFTRSLLFMPAPNDSVLLVSVGSSCNVCEEKEAERAKILAYDTETDTAVDYASGLRNSVFMEIHPVTGEIWATEMGRDGLGDDLPPDEINIIKKDGNYGWPICYGQNVHDDDFDKKVYFRNPCMAPFETPSYIDIPAHSAPLGLSFIPEEGWPQDYWYDALVAYHGSWNRSEPTGYKIVRLKLDAQGKYLGTEDFITGWLQPDGKKLGRPVDIKALPGGTIYISDDTAGKIYRVTRVAGI